MILDALMFVRDQANLTIPVADPRVVLGNISRYNDGDEFATGLQNNILLSVINVEEDTVVRHVEHFKKENNQILFKNPPIYLNLTLMFAATSTDYDSSLISIERIVLFFQKNRFFSIENSDALQAFNELHNINIEKMTFEMVNMGLDQLHQLWSGLGGHYMPSVLYKMRMLQLDASVPRGGEPIKEIKIDAWHKKQLT
jgi:hypothetical protein